MVIDVLDSLHPEYAFEIIGQRASVADEEMDVIKIKLHATSATIREMGRTNISGAILFSSPA